MKMSQWTLLGLISAIALSGCHTDMWTQAKVTPYDEDDLGLFGGTTTARPLPTGAVARGWEKLDEAKYTGFSGQSYATTFPAELTIDGEKLNSKTDLAKIMKRGKERYHIFCSHCHGALGDGKGMITQRGFVLRREPATYHSDRLRGMPVGYFYDVITNGYGIMYSQASRIKPDDRWAIVSYVRALQLSQNIPAAQLTPEDIQRMEEAKAGKTTQKADGAHGGGH